VRHGKSVDDGPASRTTVPASAGGGTMEPLASVGGIIGPASVGGAPTPESAGGVGGGGGSASQCDVAPDVTQRPPAAHARAGSISPAEVQ